MRRSILKSIVVATLVGTLLTSCYGQFALTRKIYNWNGHATGNRFANSAIMWALVIVPVYGVCMLGDFLVFNTIEFYSGSNPMATNENGVLNTRYAGHDYKLRSVGDKIEVLVDGRIAYYYRQQGERLVVEDLDGKIVRTVSTREARNQSATFGSM